jgi:hypothetical protein
MFNDVRCRILPIEPFEPRLDPGDLAGTQSVAANAGGRQVMRKTAV